MKIGQLREYNLKNISVEKPYTNCAGETSLWSFSETSKSSITLDQQSQIL